MARAALTDWLIMPLRRVIPLVGRWDLSSLVAAMLLQLAQYFADAVAGGCLGMGLAAVAGAVRVAAGGGVGPDRAVDCLCRHVLGAGGRSPLGDVIVRFSEPVLRPLRRVMPLVGGIDLSPLVALVLLQVVMMYGASAGQRDALR